jgi:hypothetical protein
MPFIGNQPAESYSAFQKQDFTTSATTSYTLDHPVANQNEIALFINFVRQEPTTAYTASGTSLTLTSATASSDDMYCVFLGKAVQTVNPPNSSVGSSQVSADLITGQTAETSIATDDTILIHDTSASALKKMTRANFVSGIGGTNTPSFMASISGGDQTLTNSATNTLALNTEVYDSDNAYNNSTYRFTVPSGEGGKYLVGLGGQFETNGVGQMDNFALRIAVNGSTVIDAPDYPGGTSENRLPYKHTSGVLNLSAADYVEPKAYISLSSGTPKFKNGAGQFFAIKIIGA